MSPYSTDNYVELINEIFSTVRMIAPDILHEERSNFSYHIAGSTHVGTYNTPDGKLLLIFAVKLQKQSGIERARSMQRNFAKKLIESGNADAALVAFYAEDDPKWRLSFVRLDYEMKIENGKLKATEKLTPAKRYSFLVGDKEPCHTALSHFHSFIVDNNSNPTLDELEEAFSVERVTQEFFDLYCEKYQQLREWLLSNEDFAAESERCHFTVEQFAKKLLGQIVFLYFLQKKGWLGVGVWPHMLTEKEYKNLFFTTGAQGRIIKEYLPALYVQSGENYIQTSRFRSALDRIPDDVEELIANKMPHSRNWGSGSQTFLRTLFDYAVKNGGHFYEKYLEPLFYDTLNKNRGVMGYTPILHCRIPFLSGGLFEPIDGFDWKSTHFDIPDEIFSNKKSPDDRQADGILDIFDRYNFTMSEDEPLEREVAIDPEMLGKVFENLLEVRDRKSKGAFYTPREIVHYMCRESLINYLVGQTEISESAVRDFILYGDFMKDEDTVKSKRQGQGDMFISEEIFKVDDEGNVVVNRLDDMDQALMSVRVVDLAVGSGAFPLGLLNEIVRARETLTEYMAVAVRTKAVSERQEAFMVRELRSKRTPYDLKRYTIKNSIFAADIEPSAVDIAQLRLWLSLVIDDEINPNAQSELDGHVNPMPLPNLECNILCGNSLVDEFEGTQLVLQSSLIGTEYGGEYSWYQQIYETMLPQLIKAQDELFYCDDTVKKQEIINKINAIRYRMLSSQLEFLSPEKKEAFYAADKMASKPFVLWQIEFARVFHEKGGFDIVIGNPPYIGESGHKEIFREVAATNFGKRFYQGKMDFFYFFFHKGLDILRNKGFCGLITTNYFLNAAGAKTLRKDFRERANILRLVNFNELKIFQSAMGQHNIITFINKEDIQLPVVCCITNRKGIANSQILDNIVSWNDKETNYFIISPDNLYDKRGNISFHEEDFILEKMKEKQNFSFSKKEVGSGIDILQETVLERHLETNPNLKVGRGVFAVETDEIPDMNLSEGEHKLLRPYYTSEQIQKYSIKGKNHKWILYMDKDAYENIDQYPNIKRHLDQYTDIITSDNAPYGLHRARKLDQFVGEKILSLRMTKLPCFTYSEEDTFVTRAYMTIKPKSKVNLRYIVALCNSHLFYYWLYKNGKRKGKQLQIDQAQIIDLPIYIPDEDMVLLLSEKVNLISQRIQNDETFDDIENEMNRLVYDIYDMTESDRHHIEQLYISQMEK